MATGPGKAGAKVAGALMGKAKMNLNVAKPRAGTPVDVHIGRRIRAARHEAGLSQTALAEACGITFQQIQKYENGANRCAPGRLDQIAKALNRPVISFFPANGAGAPAGTDRATEMAADHYGSEIIEAFLRLTTEQRSLMRDVFMAVAEVMKA